MTIEQRLKEMETRVERAEKKAALAITLEGELAALREVVLEGAEKNTALAVAVSEMEVVLHGHVQAIRELRFQVRSVGVTS